MGHQNRGNYWYNALVAFDQLGNALAGGNPDATISARIGYNANYGKTNLKYWKFLEKSVNWTFSPVDGANHCLDAYDSDKGEEYYSAGKNWVKVVLASLAVGFCIPLSIIIRIIAFIKKKLL